MFPDDLPIVNILHLYDGAMSYVVDECSELIYNDSIFRVLAKSIPFMKLHYDIQQYGIALFPTIPEDTEEGKFAADVFMNALELSIEEKESYDPADLLVILIRTVVYNVPVTAQERIDILNRIHQVDQNISQLPQEYIRNILQFFYLYGTPICIRRVLHGMILIYDIDPVYIQNTQIVDLVQQEGNDAHASILLALDWIQQNPPSRVSETLTVHTLLVLKLVYDLVMDIQENPESVRPQIIRKTEEMRDVIAFITQHYLETPIDPDMSDENREDALNTLMAIMRYLNPSM